MKALLFALIAATAIPAHAGRTLTASAAGSTVVGDTIYVSFDLPSSGQAINLAAIRSEWNESIATFHSWVLGGCVFENAISLPCNYNAQGKMKFSTTGWSSTAAGHVATMKLIAVGTGTLSIAVGNGCPTWESRPVFYNAGIIVPTDADVANVVVVVSGGGGGCHPPCEFEKPQGNRTWGRVKGLFR